MTAAAGDFRSRPISPEDNADRRNNPSGFRRSATNHTYGFPARRYELHPSASCQDTASALRIVPISSLPRYGIRIRTAILKEETDHRFMEDSASLATTSTLATWLKAMQGRFCYARKALHAMTMEQSGRWITFNEFPRELARSILHIHNM